MASLIPRHRGQWKWITMGALAATAALAYAAKKGMDVIGQINAGGAQ
jgi:hypothetical protein